MFICDMYNITAWVNKVKFGFELSKYHILIGQFQLRVYKVDEFAFSGKTAMKD